MNNINPAWNDILSKIPQALHNDVIPFLQANDQRIQQETTKYAPYKQFVEQNIDPAWLNVAAQFVKDLEANPRETMARVNREWELGFVSSEEAQRQNLTNLNPNNNGNQSYEDDVFNTGNPGNQQQVDITSHPAFKQAVEQIQQLSQTMAQQQEAQNQRAQIDAFESEIDSYLDDKKYVDKLYFTSLRSAGLSNEQALEHYNQTMVSQFGDNWQQNIKQPENTQTAPVVMDNNGTVGSGTPTDPSNFGKMSNNDIDDVVAQMLQNAANSGQG